MSLTSPDRVGHGRGSHTLAGTLERFENSSRYLTISGEHGNGVQSGMILDLSDALRAQDF